MQHLLQQLCWHYHSHVVFPKHSAPDAILVLDAVFPFNPGTIRALISLLSSAYFVGLKHRSPFDYISIFHDCLHFFQAPMA
jgi:hypothetical protein